MIHSCQNLDPASLHPRLTTHASDGHHYQCAANLREKLKAALKENYSLHDFDIYFSPNTTQGLMMCTHILAMQGYGFEIFNNHFDFYPEYTPLLDTLSLASKTTGIARLVSHISPLTGNKTLLLPKKDELLVVDAAQSFATPAHKILCNSADIFVTSLHKHAGLALGVAIICSRKNKTLPALHQLLTIGECGSHPLDFYQQALERIQETRGKIFNTACFKFANTLKLPAGFKLITTDDCSSFICISYTDPFSPPEMKIPGFGFKIFKKHHILRISAMVAGCSDDEPTNVLELNFSAVQTWLNTLI